MLQLFTMHSASNSDRSSMSSNSPNGSPPQHQVQPTPSFYLSSAPDAYNPTVYQQQTPQSKLHQPLAQRARSAIPIVDPTTRAVASPPQSVSPAHQMQGQYASRRW